MSGQMTPAEAGRAAAEEVPELSEAQAEAMARFLHAQARVLEHHDEPHAGAA